MSRDQGVPNRRLHTDQTGQAARRPQPQNGSVPQPRSFNGKQAPPRSATGKPVRITPPPQPLPARSPYPKPQAITSSVAQPQRKRSSGIRFPKSWQFWVSLGVISSLGIGGLSLALLFKIPALPNCPSVFWPTASASLRVYCAQLAANKQTVDDLLEAIALVNSLPADHPMRAEVNRYIEEWSNQVLGLGEKAFHNGDLDGAIAIANRIPENTPAYAQVEERVSRWREIWQKAEKIYQDAEDALLDQDLRKAFSIAVQLVSVGNTYWETTKYQELNDLITATRVDGGRLARANNLADRGGLSNLLEAIKLAEQVVSDSPAYAAAQRLITKFGRAMLELAEDALDRQDVDEAIDIVSKIPARAGLEQEVQDFRNLATAQSQAWGGTIADLEAAIVQAQRLSRDRPLYGRAQQLIGDWQLEIQDIARLDTARQLAEPGETGDLTAAIAEASLIPPGNPRGQEARSLIAEWTATVEAREDQPILDQADLLAANGDIASLQAAINQANQIQQGRSLYRQARNRIQDWRSRIERTQDQPILDQARQLAANGDLGGAIATAQQISSGRTLSGEVQAAIRSWQAEIQGQMQMQQAYQAANGGTPEMLVSAIRAADRVPAGTQIRAEADRMIDLWSQSIVQAAQSQAQYDLTGAIAIAESVPARSSAYAQAQLLIQSWRQQLNPPPVTQEEF